MSVCLRWAGRLFHRSSVGHTRIEETFLVVVMLYWLMHNVSFYSLCSLYKPLLHYLWSTGHIWPTIARYPVCDVWYKSAQYDTWNCMHCILFIFRFFFAFFNWCMPTISDRNTPLNLFNCMIHCVSCFWSFMTRCCIALAHIDFRTVLICGLFSWWSCSFSVGKLWWTLFWCIAVLAYCCHTFLVMLT